MYCLSFLPTMLENHLLADQETFEQGKEVGRFFANVMIAVVLLFVAVKVMNWIFPKRTGTTQSPATPEDTEDSTTDDIAEK